MSVLVGKVDCPRIRSTRLDQEAIATTTSVKISRTNATNLPLQASLNDPKKVLKIFLACRYGLCSITVHKNRLLLDRSSGCDPLANHFPRKIRATLLCRDSVSQRQPSLTWI